MYKTAYALKNNAEKNSSSGGAFPSIVKKIYECAEKANKELVIYGAAFDKEFNVVHTRIDDISQLIRLCGGKYVASRLDNIYTLVSKDLSNGHWVVFSGTPCQVSALNKYLEQFHIVNDNLFTIDIICHGTINAVIWQDFKKWIEGKYKSDISDFSFRYNASRWQSYPTMVAFENGKTVVNSFYLRRYTEIFYSDIALNKKCYSCDFANKTRCSDITIGDFWGIRKVLPDFPYHENVSSVYINSDKGKTILDMLIKDNDVLMSPCDSNAAAEHQQAMTSCVKEPANVEMFWKDYKNSGFEFVLRKYFGLNILGRLKHILKRTLGELGIVELVKEILKI